MMNNYTFIKRADFANWWKMFWKAAKNTADDLGFSETQVKNSKFIRDQVREEMTRRSVAKAKYLKMQKAYKAGDLESKPNISFKSYKTKPTEISSNTINIADEPKKPVQLLLDL